MATRAAASPQRALPAHVTDSPLLTSKRGHARSSSLENSNSYQSKNTLGLPIMQPGQTGTLKSRNEQKRMRNKFGSHNNLDDYVGQTSASSPLQQQQILQQKQGRLRFQNIRQFFEISRTNDRTTTSSLKEKNNQIKSGIPSAMTQSETAVTLFAATYSSQLQQQQQQQNQQQQQSRPAHHEGVAVRKNMGLYNPLQQQKQHLQQHQLQQQQQQATMSPRRPMPTKHATGSGNRGSIASDLGISCSEQQKSISDFQHTQQQHSQQHSQQQSQQQQQQQQQQQKQQSAHPITQRQEQFNATGSTQNLRSALAETPEQSANNILRPIAFKPIPFEPDYSIPTRYCDAGVAATAVGDRFGSTPSLAAAQGPNLRFGSTTDLRNNVGLIGVSGGVGVGVGVSVGGGLIGGNVAGYSSNNYCNSLMARRRGSRSLKINDSMESIRHTPDSDVQSQSSTIKSNCTTVSSNNINSTNSSNNNINNNIITNNKLNSNSNCNGMSNNKYALSDQCDMTPSPSDSGISDLEAALKDRDSELSYLRQTMEHNEKDKEAFWENETKRLKAFYEEQQREYNLRLKKMEQMLAMQQFQFKQHKLRHNEQSNKLREQVSDLKNENEILRCNNTSLKNSERNLKDRLAYIEEQLNVSEETVNNLRAQLEECEWRVCERNGELALLKSQLKEANVEITLKEHAIVHLKHESTNAENQIYQSHQENQKMSQQHQTETQNSESQKRATENELKQLNKIIILKDQVILALTSELAKLRKELSDLAISHEYGEEPSGKFTRLKQQLDSLSDLCNRKRKEDNTSNLQPMSRAKVLDEPNLEVIMNCLKIAPSLDSVTEEGSDDEHLLDKLSAEKRLAKMSADIQNFVYGSQNLPDVAVSVPSKATKIKAKSTGKLEEATLDTLIEESANYAEEIGKLRRQLDDVRVSFELEKSQWCEEREKVLRYQKQLQMHYINMYQKLRSLENSVE